MQKVVIVQRIVPHYRIPFFDALEANLASKGVELKLIYGQEYPGSVPKSVVVDRDWAVQIDSRYWHILGQEVVWQPVCRYVKDADLVIVEQANRLLFNYLLLLLRMVRKIKVGFWGHGKNFQSKKYTGPLESLKRLVSVNADWWFAYTGQSARLVEAMGFDPLKITVVKNSIDTSALKLARKAVSDKTVADVKRNLGITGDNIAIYCGGMYEEKKMGFLVEACRRIKGQVPDFNMIFIGDGPDATLVKHCSDENDWIHYLGSITGDKRVPFFCVSKLLLMPGLVGLVVLDSFALKTPMVTTEIPIHSPEFEYLMNGYNGYVTQHNLDSYTKSVSDLLTDDSRYLTLLEGCEVSSDEFSVENMAINFSNGIVASLNIE